MQVNEFISLLNQAISVMPANVLANFVNTLNVQLASDLTGAFAPIADSTTLDRVSEAMSGDMVLDISPATVDTAPTAAAWDRTVTITLKNAAGDTHTWFNKTVTSGHSVGDASTAGTATCDPATDTVYTNGVATVTVSGDAQNWLNSETDTLTIADLTIMGTTVTGGTSVETFKTGA